MKSRLETERLAYMNKENKQLEDLQAQGLILAGNPLSPIIFIKGELTDQDLEQGLLSGPDGSALKAALGALGYAPEDWYGMASAFADRSDVTPEFMRLAVDTCSPTTVVLCDERAAQIFKNAYAQELTALDSFDEAMLLPGFVAHILGMRTMNLGGFEEALKDEQSKRVKWSYLKKIPPLSEPY